MKNLIPTPNKKYSLLFFMLFTFLTSPNLIASTTDRNPRGFGTYDEYFKNRTFPYTFIIPDSSSPLNFINRIKLDIQTDAAKKFLLSFIFERYNSVRSTQVFHRDTLYEKSMKAKLAAFIYMIGLKYNVSTDKVDTLPSFGHPDREIYAEVAHSILNFIPFPRRAKGNYFNGIDNQRRRSFELLNYLQAYDYLKTAKCVLQNSNVPNDVGIRELLMEFTFQLHAASNNWNQSYSRNNNLSLIAASAVGTAAVIFHAEGAGRFQYGRQPERWAHAAHGYIARTLFEGKSWTNLHDEGPMLSKGFVTTYAEGSHYFTYAWQCMLVFMKTYYRAKGINSLTDGSDPGGREYNPCKLCVKVPSEPYNSSNYQNLYKGYIESLDPKNGLHPVVDDTWKPDRRFAPLLALGDNRYTPYFKDFDSITSFKDNIFDFLGPGENHQAFETNVLLTFFRSDFEGLPTIVNHDKAGYVVLSDSNLYVYLNAERGKSVEGGFHEQGDVGSFEIRAGNKLTQMVIDPYYFGDNSVQREWVQGGERHNSILTDTDGPHKKDGAESSFGIKNSDWIYANGSKASYYTMLVKYNYWNRWGQWNMRTALTRKLSIIKDYYSYIIIEDNVTNNSLLKNDIIFKMNGNGFIEDSTFYFRDDYKSAIWSKPCILDPNNNRMRLRTILLDSDSNKVRDLTFTSDGQNLGTDGPISIVKSEPTALKSGKNLRILSIIELIPCSDTAGMLRRNIVGSRSYGFNARPCQAPLTIMDLLILTRLKQIL
jgi:hypothetical protein